MHGTGSSYVAAALSFLLLAAHAPLPAMAQGDQQLNFKIYNPDAAGQASSAPASEPAPSYFSVPISPTLQTEAPQLDKDPPKQAETPQAPAAPQEAAARMSPRPVMLLAIPKKLMAPSMERPSKVTSASFQPAPKFPS